MFFPHLVKFSFSAREINSIQLNSCRKDQEQNIFFMTQHMSTDIKHLLTAVGQEISCRTINKIEENEEHKAIVINHLKYLDHTAPGIFLSCSGKASLIKSANEP